MFKPSGHARQPEPVGLKLQARLLVEVRRHTAAAQAAEMHRIAWRHMGDDVKGISICMYVPLSNSTFRWCGTAPPHKHRDDCVTET